MKTIVYGQRRNQEADVPENWDEGLEMLLAIMDPFHDERGGNMARLSCAARVAYGMFGEQLFAADPTTALVYLMQRVCQLEGAGLNDARKVGEDSGAR